MQETIKFEILLPLESNTKLKRIKEKSYYDHNYYLLPNYGDWISFGRDDNRILYEEYSECENIYTYSFGHFDKDGEFVVAISFISDGDVLENISVDCGE